MNQNFIITGISRVVLVGKNEYPQGKIRFNGHLFNNELIYHFSGKSTVHFNGKLLAVGENTIRFLPKGKNKEYNVDLEINGYDRRGLLNEVLQAIAETKTNITQVTGKTDRNKIVTIHLSISIQNVAHLKKVVDRIKQIHDIYTVRRVMN